MKTSLEHLPATKQQELQKLVELIRQQSGVEMIILFGSYARGDWVEEYADDGIHFQYQSDYDLLVIIKTPSRHKQIRLEADFMLEVDEQLPEIQTPVSIIVHSVGFVNQRMEMAQYFFSDIKKQGIALYDTGKVVLKEPRQLSDKERYQLAKEDFEHWYANAVDFYAGFDFYFSKEKCNQAAFLLHQTTESLYTAILLVLTRYKPNIHDLSILRRTTNSLDTRLIKIFPIKDYEARRLFRLLRDAYVDARYKKDYVITPEELNWLAQRVKELEQMVKLLCEEQIQKLLRLANY